MADVVDVGSAPNDGTGVDYRAAFIAINAAFKTILARLGQTSSVSGDVVTQDDLNVAIKALGDAFAAKAAVDALVNSILDATAAGLSTKLNATPAALTMLLSAFEDALPTTEAGVPVGGWWSNGGIPTRKKA